MVRACEPASFFCSIYQSRNVSRDGREGERIIINMKKTVNVGVIGFGTVGSGVVSYFQEKFSETDKCGVFLKTVADADTARPRDIKFSNLVADAAAVINDPEIDIVVELIGGERPASDFIIEALEKGKSVVTANKYAVSRHMPRFFEAARSGSADLGFEAAVAGSIPILSVLRGYRNQPFHKITGILNGTCNFMLSRMESGMGFEEALSLAQEKGFAESDHILDTGGFDSRDKLAIIASLVFNTHIDPEKIYCEGITSVTDTDLDFAVKYRVEEGEPGYTVKSLASVQHNGESLELYVYPALIRKDHPLASVRDELNAVYLEGAYCGPQLMLGKGAGMKPTASAVVSDIFRIAENIRRGVNDPLPSLDNQVQIADVNSLKRQGYIRIGLTHVPGSFAAASKILADAGMNVKDSVQRWRFKKDMDGVPVIPDIVTVEPESFQTVADAMEHLRKSDHIIGEPFYLRFEE